MEDFLLEWMVVSTIIFLVVATPGPDFIITIRNSVLGSRAAGIMTAIGIGLGILVHVTYCLLGIAALISQSVLVFTILKYCGAAYLAYIGFKALRSKGYVMSDKDSNKKPLKNMTALKALRSGFLTNLLNPKATLFFLALFTQIIDPSTPTGIQIIFGVTSSAIAMVWFTFVSIALTTKHIHGTFLRFSKWIDRTCGGLLVALGVKLSLSSV